MHRPVQRFAAACTTCLALAASTAGAQAPPQPPFVQPGNGKLLLTGGVSSIDGAAGGGLTPWAVTGGYATAGEVGATAFVTRVVVKDYALTGYGVAVSALDRVEVSLARQDFKTYSNLAPLSPAFAGLHLKQDIAGVKVRLAGDAVLDSDTWMPQLAAGLEYKHLDAGPLAPVLASLGADDHGVDLYLSATKLFLAQGVLVNATLRATKANQNGLLGFGSSAHDDYKLMPEISVAWLPRKDVAIGAEYRMKPDNLNPSPFGAGLKEDDWKDVFVAWAPSKHVSLTLAWVDLGRIAPALVPDRQTGVYVSAQVAY